MQRIKREKQHFIMQLKVKIIKHFEHCLFATRTSEFKIKKNFLQRCYLTLYNANNYVLYAIDRTHC